MIDSQVQTEILQILSGLSLPKQQMALDFVRELKSTLPPGTPGSELVKHAGRISLEDGLEMEKYIEEECGQIETEVERQIFD